MATPLPPSCKTAASTQNVRITPSLLGRRVVFDHHCTCRIPGCAHLAAAAFAALDRFPVAAQAGTADLLRYADAAAPEKERQRMVFELAPAEPPHACVVTTLLIGERTGIATPTTPRQIASDEGADPAVRDLALPAGRRQRDADGVSPARVVDLLDALMESGQARWHAGGRRLMRGRNPGFRLRLGGRPAAPLRRDRGATGPWYVDATTGAVGRVRIQPPRRRPRRRSPPRAPVDRRGGGLSRRRPASR